ncbi:hypothetical protein CHUAL_014110 [Chamberlinius hualienensis]
MSSGKKMVENEEQLQSINVVSQWIKSQAPFCGRTDEQFVLMFLRGCKFDIDKTKKKITAYYRNRLICPKWWDDREITNELINLSHHQTVTLLDDEEPHLPSVEIFRFSKFGPNLSNLDKYFKLYSIGLEVILRRPNTQLNGHIMICDFKDYPLWLIPQFMSLRLAKNYYETFYLAAPIMVKKVIGLNCPFMAHIFLNHLMKPFLSEKLKSRIVLYGSQWPNLTDHVPKEMLPEEYGGTAGPIEKHHSTFKT